MARNRTVRYVDFGYSTAKQFWEEAGLPAYDRFKAAQNRQTAIEASLHAWHIHEWHWHELNPGSDTHNNSEYLKFRAGLIEECEELAWVRDIADASKHRGLGRPGEVTGVNNAREGKLRGRTINGHPHRITIGPTIDFTDGTRVDLLQVLGKVVAFWNARLV